MAGAAGAAPDSGSASAEPSHNLKNHKTLEAPMAALVSSPRSRKYAYADPGLEDGLAAPSTSSVISPQVADTSGSSASDTAADEAGPMTKVLHLSDEDVDIDYRAPLGSGGFGMVYQVYLRDEHTGEFDREKPYALKRLRTAIVKDKDPAILKFASKDMKHEVKILSNLTHRNINKLYAIRQGDMDASLREGTFFMVLEMLTETLDSRLEKWSKSRRFFKQITPHEQVVKRLREVVVGTAKGMEYLHSKNIMFRDLKPANIGFDRAGRVKIFDFGLARVVCPGQSCRITGKVGTPRYMAPEIAHPQGSYGLPADVYSFGILSWQIVTSRVPFENIMPSSSGSSLFGGTKAIPEDERPSLKYVECMHLKALLQSSWAANPDVRPTFHTIGLRLQKVITEMEERRTAKRSQFTR